MAVIKQIKIGETIYDLSPKWDNIESKPVTFPPSSHNHNDIYYTETEINDKLSKKSDNGHTHETLNTAFKFNNADMHEEEANLGLTTTAHTINFYRNGLSIPYQMDNAHDGGILRCRGKSEASTIFELGTWDDEGAGETIQFNYYSTTSQVTPKYSVTVPKKSGTILLNSDVIDNLTSANTDKPLSANQGKALKSYIDTYFPPARVGNDSTYSNLSTSFIGGVSGGPRINDWEFLYRAEHRNGSGDGSNYIMEMVSNLTSDSSIYWRKKTGGNFTAFREIIDSNNIGNQSVKSATTADSAIRSNYFNSVASASGGNTSTYSWRRIMSMGPTTNNYEDRVGTYYLSGNYHGGPWYLFRVEFRTHTSSNGDVGSFRIAVIATNSNINNLAIASYSVATNGVTTSYADVFVKVGAYPRMTLTRLSASDKGIITYYNSNEGDNASSRTEAYKDINGSGAGYASSDLHSLSTYPAVTNGVINSKFVTTDTDQTITGYKKFSSIGIDTINGATLGNAIMRQDTSTGEVILGSTARPLRLWGNQNRPVYSTDNGANYKDIAFTSDIPGAATQSANGLMSSADKKKLDGIAEGANRITVDSSLSSSSTNPVQNMVIYAALAPTVVYDSNFYVWGESGSWRFIQNSASANSLDIKYGTIPINNQNKTYDVSFGNKKFNNGSYTVVFGLLRSDRDSWFWSPLVKTKSNSGFTVYVRGNTSGDNVGTLMYLAIKSN